MRAHSWILLLVLVTFASAPADAQPPTSSEDAPAPAFEPPDTRPGRSTRLSRAWEGQPPLVPHSLRGLTPITATRGNGSRVLVSWCAGCAVEWGA